MQKCGIIIRTKVHNSPANQVHSTDVTSVPHQSFVTFAVSVYRCAMQCRFSHQRHVEHVLHDPISTVERICSRTRLFNLKCLFNQPAVKYS